MSYLTRAKLFGGDRITDKSKVDAIMRSQAVIEFDVDGTIRSANDNFLKATGYSLSEIEGKHHRIFVDPVHADSDEYASFWQRLAAGEYESGEYCRIAKDGAEIWLQASYNPLLNASGKIVGVMKIAEDVTAQKQQASDDKGRFDAIMRSQAVIEFNLDGTIRTANANFLNAMGYSLDEIRGRHHSMFVDPKYGKSQDYAHFWERLRGGEFIEDQFLRFGKGGREVWIRASYNPVFNMKGEVVKVIKFARDITERIKAERVLEALMEGLEVMSEGDLTRPINDEFTGRHEAVRKAFNSCLSGFRDIIANVRSTSHSLKTATGEILSGANDLSDRTTRQAAAIEQTSAAMSALSDAIIENAGKADDALQKAESSSRMAETGGEVMDRATTAMERITQSSAKISNIIGLIDDIAFQTNLLALNASVEAARAGEAGKGFAVVAIEVRRLAQSAAEASSDVKTLIDQSSSEVSEGSQLVAEASTKLRGMLETIGQNAALMREIASASRTQADAVGEVNTSIRQMDEMTQHNAALVEETNAAIEQTEAHAQDLDRLVEQFRLTASATGTRSRAA